MRLIARLGASWLVVSVALLLPSFTVAQESRSIPRTPRNEQFFALSQSLFAAGQFQQSSCGAERPDIQECIVRCNSPGTQERDGCCCIIEDATFFIGVRGGCRYNQRIQNFTQSFIYKSTPINSDKPYFDRLTCAFTDVDANGDSCTCTLQWDASDDELDAMSPIPSPSNSPSPVLSAPMSVPPVRTPEPTDTPTVEPTVQPTTVPTIVTPPTSTTTAPSTTAPPTTAVSPTDPPPAITPFDDDTEPSPSPEDDGSVCVDQSYLVRSGYGAEHLVHADGIMSPVLCPQHHDLPCASPNHKVRYDGRDLSYRQLCDNHAHMRCVANQMLVNSVFTHVWREVQHGDVQLTMFDSRYGEFAQKALHSLLHKVRVVRKRLV